MWRAYRRPSLAARLRPGPAGVSPPGVRLGSESLFGFGRNGCSASLGIGVRLQSERPLGFRRNLHHSIMGSASEMKRRRALLAELLGLAEAAEPNEQFATEGGRIARR